MNIPTCWIVAGVNGAGKTTFALECLPDITHCQRFINADLIIVLKRFDEDKKTS